MAHSKPLNDFYDSFSETSCKTAQSGNEPETKIKSWGEWLCSPYTKAVKLNNLSNKLIEFTDDVEDVGVTEVFLKSLGMSKEDIIIGALLAADIGDAIYRNDKVAWSKLLFGLGLTFTVKGGLNKIWDFMSSEDIKTNKIHKQSDSFSMVIAGLSVVVMLATGYLTGANQYDKKTCQTTWDVLSKKGRDIFNIKSGFLSIMTIYTTLQECLVEAVVALGLYEVDTRLAAKRRFNSSMYMYTNKLSLLCRKMDSSRMDIDDDTKDTWQEIVEHRSSASEALATGLLEREHTFKFNGLNREYERCLEFFSDKYRQRTVKVDPPHYSFFGEPGIGKASVILNTCDLLMKHFSVDPVNNMYVKAGDSVYFDNYSGQWLMLIDEKDAVQNPSNVTTSNEIQSCAPMIVNMANEKKKGRPFSTKMIVSATNAAYPQFDGTVSDVRAYHRRRVLISADPTPEFLAIPERDRVQYIDNDLLSHLTFSVLASTNVNVEGATPSQPPAHHTGMTYAEMIKFVLNDALGKLTYQHKLVKSRESDFPFDMPTGSITDVEQGIAELIVEREERCASYDYASAEARLTMNRAEFANYMHSLTEVLGKKPLVKQQIRRTLTPEEVQTIKENLSNYVASVNEKKSKIARKQGPVNSREPVPSIPLGRPAVESVIGRTHDNQCVEISFDQVESLTPVFVGDSLEFNCLYRDTLYRLSPTPYVYMHCLLQTREALVESIGSNEGVNLAKNYGMSFEQYRKFLQNSHDKVLEIDQAILADRDLCTAMKDFGVIIQDTERIVKHPESWGVSDRRTVIKTANKYTLAAFDGFKSLGVAIREGCRQSFWDLVEGAEHLIEPEGSHLAEFADDAIHATKVNHFRNWKMPRVAGRILSSVVGKVNGNYILPIHPVSYNTLGYYDLENYDAYAAEAQRTGSIRNGVFYFLQRSNNYRMNMENGYFGSGCMVRALRLIIEAYIYMFYVGESFASYVLGSLARFIKKITIYICNKMKEFPKISLALGAAALGLAWYNSEKIKNAFRSNGQADCEGADRKIQGHDHRDVQDDGMPHSHIHQCLKCNDVYAHSHKKHPDHVSKRFPHYCRKCRTKINKLETEGDLIDEADVVIKSSDELSVTVAREQKDKRTVVLLPAPESSTPTKGKRSAPPARIVVEQKDPTDEERKAAYDGVVFTYESDYTKPKSENDGEREISNDGLKSYNNGKAMKQGARSSVFAAICKKMRLACVEINLGDICVSAICIGGHFLLTYQHVIGTRVRQYKRIAAWCTRLGELVHFFIDEENFTPLKNFKIGNALYHSDLCVVRVCSTRFAPGSNMVPFFTTENKWMKANHSPGYLFGMNQDTMVMKEVGQITAMSNTGYDGDDVGFNTGRTFAYDFPTIDGDCGCVLAVDNPALGANIILGMHVAGAKGIGFSSVITQEMLYDVIDIDSFVTPQCPFDVIDDLDLDEAGICESSEVFPQKTSRYWPQGTACFPIGLMKKELHMPTGGDIQTSPLFDHLPHELEPTALKASDPRLDEYQLPMLKSTEKFVLGTGGWDPQHCRVVTDYLIQKYVRLYRKSGDFPTAMLTEHEAINGVPRKVEKLNMHTSCGFPMERFKPNGEVGKKWAFDNIGTEAEPVYKCGSYMRKALDEVYSSCEEGEYRGNYVKDVPKVEKRKVERVQAGETRLFNIFNCANLIAIKRVCGVMSAVQLKYKWFVNSTLGINVHGFDPSAMFAHGLRVGPKLLEGDFTGWDGRFDPQTMQICIDVVHGFNKALGFYRNSFVSERAAKAILHSAMYRFHIFGDVVYYMFTAHGSGTWVTGFFNTIGHDARDRMTWIESVEEQIAATRLAIERKQMQTMFKHTETYNDDPHCESELEDLEEQLVTHITMCSMSEMDKHVQNNNNGDDKLAFVSEEGARYFNAPTLERLYANKGIIYTPPEKPRDFAGYGDDDGFRTLEQVQFLKSKFRRDIYYHQIVRMMMEERTIRNLPTWVRKSPDANEACTVNIEDALRFAVHHGREKFNALFKEFEAACLKSKTVMMPIISFDECERAFYASCGVRAPNH